MNKLDKVLKGLNLYPVVGEKYINIVLKVDMKKEFKDIFELDCTFDEFINDLKSDELTRKIATDVLYEYYGFKKMPIITDSSYENWYFVEFNDKAFNKYTFSYVDKIGSMNTLSMLDDYVDLFNNSIVYRPA